jgi:hypothetical protein
MVIKTDRGMRAASHSSYAWDGSGRCTPRSWSAARCGLDFLAKAAQEWIGAVGAKTTYITLGSPRETALLKALMRACAANP